MSDRSLTIFLPTFFLLRPAENIILVTLQVKQIGSGQESPWTLEGKTNSADFASSHKAGDPVCIQGVLSGFVAREHRSWAYNWGISRRSRARLGVLPFVFLHAEFLWNCLQ